MKQDDFESLLRADQRRFEKILCANQRRVDDLLRAVQCPLRNPPRADQLHYENPPMADQCHIDNPSRAGARLADGRDNWNRQGRRTRAYRREVLSAAVGTPTAPDQPGVGAASAAAPSLSVVLTLSDELDLLADPECELLESEDEL